MTDARQEPGAPLTVAAVDLGSNSFHMVVARFVGPDLHILDRMREPVRLAEGLDDDHRISDAVRKRALACLERMGQRLRGLPPEHVRAVGTNTLRRARSDHEFRQRAAEALGHPVEIVSGHEEARLIYLGVAHSHAMELGRRIVVDIGGGSTEVILGQGFDVLEAHSLFMGCVDWSRRHFPDGALSKQRMRQAEIAARLELRSLHARLRESGIAACIGSSGTIRSVSEILRLEGWSDGTITAEGLRQLRRALVTAGNMADLRLRGLEPDRASVFPGGVAILSAVFGALRLDGMTPSTRALREGVLYDLVGRIRHEDVRERTIRRLVEQYHVDTAQVDRVEGAALALFDRFREPWSLDEPHRKLLRWACRLHEIGLAVSYTGYHKHGAYLAQNSDMPGFSSDDQAFVAALVRGHRRKLSRSLFAHLGSEEELALRLAVLLRMAVLLQRSRATSAPPLVRPGSSGVSLAILLPPGWAEEHPLTLADLENEAALLASVGVPVELAVADAEAADASG
jgi:exopolyphosphatase/guanosine-5'-triphosphate,3'-diphosphate pyrophosphatase